MNCLLWLTWLLYYLFRIDDITGSLEICIKLYNDIPIKYGHDSSQRWPWCKHKSNHVMIWGWGLNMISGPPDIMVHGAIMGPVWGRQDPGGPHVGPMNFAIWANCVETSTFLPCIGIKLRYPFRVQSLNPLIAVNPVWGKSEGIGVITTWFYEDLMLLFQT